MKMTPQVVEQTIRRSMAALRVPKLDLVQMHWWDYEIPGMVDVAKSLADLREKGLITSIGTTNMSTEALARIVDTGVPVVCNQVLINFIKRIDYRRLHCLHDDEELINRDLVSTSFHSSRIQEGKCFYM